MTNAYSEFIEKVAQDLIGREFPGTTWENAPAEGVREMMRMAARNAVPAVIQALIEMDLPDEADKAVDAVPFVGDSWEPEFRAILTVLKPLLTKEAQP